MFPSAKIIIDTSVWIDFFHQNLSSSDEDRLKEMIHFKKVAITDVVLCELLVGASDEKDYLKIKRLFEPIEILRISDTDLNSFYRFSFDLKKKGLLGKYTDLSIAFLGNRHMFSIWSFDRYFQKLETKGLISLL